MMEAWQVQQQLYAEQGRSGDQAYEDLVARRVLRGLGARNAQRDISVLEHRVLGEASPNTPLWPRTKRLFITLLSRIPKHAHLVRTRDIQAVRVKDNADAIERMTDCTDHKPGMQPLLLARIADTTVSRAYMLWPADALYELVPTFEVVPADLGVRSLRLVIQDTTHFVRSLGPYPLETWE